jgi:hypothetical protein
MDLIPAKLIWIILRGIYATYDRPSGTLSEENQQLKSELQRQTGLTSIGGGAPGRVGSGSRAVNSLNDFQKTLQSDMRKHLTKGAKSGMPML